MSHFIYSKNLELSEIVIKNPRILLMLEHFEINLPLQEKTVQKICSEYHINVSLFIEFIHLYSDVNYISDKDFEINDIPVILNYLKNSHKYYLNEIYPLILGAIKQLHEYNNDKEILLVENFFNDYFSEVKEHLNYENEVVFPYVQNLYNSITNCNKPLNDNGYKVHDYKDHHNDIEEKLDDLINLLIKYLSLKDVQQIRRKLVFNLTELDYDLKVHAKVEDLILIPLVEKMEQMAIHKV